MSKAEHSLLFANPISAVRENVKSGNILGYVYYIKIKFKCCGKRLYKI